MEKIIFYIIAIIIIAFSFMAVNSKNLLRSAVYLLFVMLGIAGFYFLINYDFLGAVQLSVYAGGIVVLIVFAVLLTHDIDKEMESPKLSKKLLIGITTIAGAGLTIWTIMNTKFAVKEGVEDVSVDRIGTKLMSLTEGGYVLPFEVISVLLLAAMISAIIVAKGRKLN